MCIIRTTFTHLGLNGHLNGDIHSVPKGMVKRGCVVFAHGYKGFKDWGAWGMMGDMFAEEGWAFVRFNFSHNGHVLPDLNQCSDELAWGKNTYSKEKSDLEEIILKASESCKPNEKIIVIGHSRGGGIAALAAANSHVDGVVLLASVSDFARRFPEGDQLEAWRKTDRLEVVNGRTQQVLSHLFSFFEDFTMNADALNIESAVRSLKVPLLAVHGDSDKAVSDVEGRELAGWATQGQFVSIPDTGHTFGTSHPWTDESLPPPALKAMSHIVNFINNVSH